MKKALIAAIVAIALIVFSVYTIYNSESSIQKLTHPYQLQVIKIILQIKLLK